MAKDPKGTLKALSTYGYSQIESFQGDKGVFWGMKPKEYSDFISSLGMKLYGSHCNSEYPRDPKLLDEFKRLADDSAGAGIKYLINPFLGHLKTKDEFKRVTEGFNKCGEICEDRGIRYAYHNHHYSFMKLDGEFPQDIMMKGSDPKLVDFEMDIYWVYVANQKPEDWLNKYSGRFKMGHIKDRYKAEKVAEILKAEDKGDGWPVNVSCVLGTGHVDWDNVLASAKSNGMEYFMVEQERYDNSTPMEDAKKDAMFMNQYKRKSFK
jgi:sugar phosphate isomerase/epimerase